VVASSVETENKRYRITKIEIKTMSDIKKLAGQTVIYGIPTILGRLLNYLLVPLYTYTLPTQEYGVVSELYAYVSFLMIILTYGMETAFFRFNQTAQDKRVVYNTSLLSLICSTTLFLIVTFLCLNPICSVMEYSDHKNYIALFLLIISLDALRAIPYALLRAQQKAKRFALVKSVDIFSNIAFNLFFILLCPVIYDSKPELVSWFFNPQDLVLYIFVSNCFASLISFILLAPQYRQFQRRFDFHLLKHMLAYGLPVMIGGLAGMVNETFDRIALKHLVSVPETMKTAAQISSYKMSQIGIYGACYKLSIVISLFIQAFKFAAEPFFFSKMQNKDARQSYANIMTAFVVFLCIIFLGVMGYMEVFKYFIGREYRVGLVVVPILMIGNIFLGIYYNLSIWYKVTDHTKYGAYIALFGAAITLVLNWVLVPWIGYLGAAITTMICYIAIAVVCYFVGQHFYKVPYRTSRILFYIFFALVLYLIMRILPLTNRWSILAVNTILILVFVFIALRLDFPWLNFFNGRAKK
jgi:Membrane protein involved in the export of O-antigen and teichoic acid